MSGLPSPVKVKSRTKYDGEPQLALNEPTARFFAPLFIKKVEERKLFFWIPVFTGMTLNTFILRSFLNIYFKTLSNTVGYAVKRTPQLRWGFLIKKKTQKGLFLS